MISSRHRDCSSIGFPRRMNKPSPNAPSWPRTMLFPPSTRRVAHHHANVANGIAVACYRIGATPLKDDPKASPATPPIIPSYDHTSQAQHSTQAPVMYAHPHMESIPVNWTMPHPTIHLRHMPIHTSTNIDPAQLGASPVNDQPQRVIIPETLRSSILDDPGRSDKRPWFYREICNDRDVEWSVMACA